MKLIHIASFNGNIGDCINHKGFYSLMNIKEDDVKKIEIRYFYENAGESRKFFNLELIDEINTSDLLVLGGGGFFDVCRDTSETGTTISMSKEFIDRIKVPVLVNAMGVHYYGYHEDAVKNFKDFFEYISNKKNWLITVRNDGSLKRLNNLLKKDTKTLVVPDNGFIYSDRIQVQNERISTVGMCLTDEIDRNFIDIKYEDYFQLLIILIDNLLNKKFKLKFFAHTPQDLVFLGRLIDSVGKEKFRAQVEVCEYNPHMNGVESYINKYKECDLIISSRFHSNVVAISCGIPALALGIHNQITDLFEELGLEKYCIDFSKEIDNNMLFRKIEEVIVNRHAVIQCENQIMESIIYSSQNYKNQFNKFIIDSCCEDM